MGFRVVVTGGGRVRAAAASITGHAAVPGFPRGPRKRRRELASLRALASSCSTGLRHALRAQELRRAAEHRPVSSGTRPATRA
jgi:hypothetical protein